MLVDLEIAKSIADRERPWSLTMVNWATGDIFTATGRRRGEMVEIDNIPKGSLYSAMRLVSFEEMESLVEDKLEEDFTFIEAPYFGMSDGNIAELGGHIPSADPTGIGPVVSALPTHPVTPSSLTSLGNPWDTIVVLEKVVDAQGNVAKYRALDAQNQEVFSFTKYGGEYFSAEHGLTIVQL